MALTINTRRGHTLEQEGDNFYMDLNFIESMRRRPLLTGITTGFAILAGCMNRETSTGANSSNNEPTFEVNEDTPSSFILLRNQPQNPNGILVGDEFEIGIHLGNAGGETASGEISIKLTPPDEDGPIQTATFRVDGDDAIPSGEARFFTFGRFEATVTGDWELTAASGIDQTHHEYDEIIEVRERSDD